MPNLTESQGVLLMLAAVGVILLLVWWYDSSKGRSWDMPDLPPPPHIKIPHPTPAQIQGLKDRVNQWRNKNCPVCQGPTPCNCPAQRPTMEDAQNACAGMDPTNGVPFTADCINAIYGVYGCNPRYPDPATTPDQINYNNSSLTNFSGVNSDAYAWSTIADDVHRNGCYAPGGVPQ